VALSWLERAEAAGWRNMGGLARDRFFDGIRTHPGFQQIAARMQADVDMMLKRAKTEFDTLFTRH
jgi:hypothetical protein